MALSGLLFTYLPYPLMPKYWVRRPEIERGGLDAEEIISDHKAEKVQKCRSIALLQRSISN